METRILYKPTGAIYQNRKEAKVKMGHGNFNKAVKARMVVFLSQFQPSDIAF
jgi:hypothetical protein